MTADSSACALELRGLSASSRAQLLTVARSELCLPSGRLVAADPWCPGPLAPLSILVPPGRYPIALVVARRALSSRSEAGRGRMERGLSEIREVPLYARLQLAEEAPVCFSVATSGGQTLGEGGHGVVSGTGALMAWEAACALREGRAQLGFEDFCEPHAEGEPEVARTATRTLDPRSGGSAFMFSAEAERLYTFFGHAASGRIVAVISSLSPRPPRTQPPGAPSAGGA